MRRFIITIFASLIMAATVIAGKDTGSDPVDYASTGMREISTTDLVHEMGIGINLGNTMEACGDWIADVDRQWGDG
ncbi:MAG: hypothetical protein IK071_04280, partial [Lachnospiraceae bacterium]|nr:hypothetical protein [Lachnospiraceae bacterium]